MDEYIMKPIDIEKTLSSLSAAPRDPKPSCTEKMLWGKAEALERLGGDEDLLRDLCKIFCEESPKLLQRLRHAIADADAGAVMHAGHSLKGELGYLGADEAAQAARELEDMGHANNLLGAWEVFTLLERELVSLHLAMKNSAGAMM
jgi:two-component system, sensor histidine kinase and response regulator